MNFPMFSLYKVTCMDNYYKIAISGDLGSGKSTISKMIEDKLSFRRYSTGDLQRKIAEKYNMTTLELNKYSETHPEIDEEIDNATAELSNAKENIVFDSRLAWHFVPESFKIRLIVNNYIASERIYNASRGAVESYTSSEDALDKIIKRKNSEQKRYLEMYNVELYNLSNYDLVIDTSYTSPENITQLILDKFNAWKENKKINKYWLSPKNLYPTKEIKKNPNMDSKIINDSGKPQIICVDGNYFIFKGHRIVGSALQGEVDPIPVDILAKDNELLPIGKSAKEYVTDNYKLDAIKTWEDYYDFKFLVYPFNY